MTSLPHPFLSECGRETSNLVCVALHTGDTHIDTSSVGTDDTTLLNYMIQSLMEVYGTIHTHTHKSNTHGNLSSPNMYVHVHKN